MTKNRRVPWNVLAEEERGDSSTRSEKKATEDDPVSQVMQRQDDYRGRSGQINKNQLEDTFYIHPNDHTNLQLVAVPLTEVNLTAGAPSVSCLVVQEARKDIFSMIWKDSSRSFAGDKGYGHLKISQKSLRMRQQYMVSQVYLLYPVKVVVRKASEQELESLCTSIKSGSNKAMRMNVSAEERLKEEEFHRQHLFLLFS